jgi:magnesium-transporting ATPase (P-type)
VQQQIQYSSANITSWSGAMEHSLFRKKLIIGIVIQSAILIFFPYFFSYIEQRQNGLILHDWILEFLTARDMSIPIFIILWSTTLLAIYRCVKQPAVFLTILYSLIFLCFARMLAIYFVHLDPPENLIPLNDPLTSITYGGRGLFITKDLFFSGHTSNMLLLALCLPKKSDKIIAFSAAISIGIMLLIQHVHYSVDVLGAILITLLLVRQGKRVGSV